MRIGVIGAGVIGQLRAQTIRERSDTTLAAVLDVSADAARRAAAGTTARVCTTDLDSFFDVPMDAIVVSTPVHVHEPACIAAFARGLHVLCEKPLSNTVESCRRIVDAAIGANCVLAVGFNLRYYPAIAFVKDAIDRGLIGDIDHLRIFGGHEGLPKFRADWQYRAPESGGGAMMDVGIHMTDLARYFLGEISDVYGVMSESVWHVPGSEDNAVAVFRNPAGTPAIYQATWNEWKGYVMFVEAYGNRGMVRGSYAPMQNVLITQDQPGAARKTTRRFYPEIMIREKLQSWHSTARLSFSGELRDFLARIGGRCDVALADGYDGLRSVEVAAAVRESTTRGEAVRLPALGRMAR
jgi:predicted dehydrogenase